MSAGARGARWLFVGAALVVDGARLAVATELPPALSDAAQDRVVTRTVVPDAARAVGEVRLVERGGGTVVQTLLATRLLGRVVGEIRQKETANWPAGVPGRAAMQAYLDALSAAQMELETRRDADPAGDRRLRVAIEFVADARAAGVILAEFETAAESPLVPAGRRVLRLLPLDRAYVVRNMRLILADAFHVAEPEVDHLGALGPAAAPSR